MDRIKRQISDENTFITFYNEENNIRTHFYTIRNLQLELDGFDERLALALKKNELIDKEFALSLKDKAQALLNLTKNHPNEEYTTYALAAVSYFLNPEDGSNDFEEIDGFDDDAEVIDAVIKVFNLDI